MSLAPLSRWASWRPAFPLFRVIAGFHQASAGVTFGLLAVSTATGLLMPAFVLATGSLVQAVQLGTSLTVPVVLLGLIFACHRVLNPLIEALGEILEHRVNESLDERIMAAMSAPVGLGHIEDPALQNRLAQARGQVGGITAGQAARQFSIVWSQRIQGACSLLIVARWYWWLALMLVLAYVVGFSLGRWHFQEMTSILYGRTEELRRAHYIRGLSLGSQTAKEIRVFDLAQWLVDRYRGSALAVMGEVWNKRREGWVAAGGLFLGLAALELFALSFIARDAVAGHITLAVGVAVSQAVLGAGLLSMYMDFDWVMSEAASMMAKVRQLEDAVRSVATIEGGTRSATGLPRNAIRFEDVGFTYPGRSDAVFTGLSLDIEAGSSLAIVGANGAGKTTLVKLLARLYEPSVGRITVDGIDLRELSPDSWHRRLAAVFQDFARFEMPAYDSLALGALHAWANKEGVEQAAREAGALDMISRLPHRWETVLSRQFREGADLSGGEWQRLALGRALFAIASGASVLILDEPTASLDVRAEAAVYQRFLELTRGVTTIVISHRFSTVRQADRIVVIEHGQLVEDGTHDSLLAVGERYAEMYRLQASRFETEVAADA